MYISHSPRGNYLLNFSLGPGGSLLNYKDALVNFPQLPMDLGVGVTVD